MPIQSRLRTVFAASLAAWMFLAPAGLAQACTCVRLKAEDGTYIVGRTMEWGTFDIEPALAIVPRGTAQSAMKIPDGKDGASWKAKYGFTGSAFWAGRPTRILSMKRA
jgi:choloylglycine hydrolase